MIEKMIYFSLHRELMFLMIKFDNRLIQIRLYKQIQQCNKPHHPFSPQITKYNPQPQSSFQHFRKNQQIPFIYIVSAPYLCYILLMFKILALLSIAIVLIAAAPETKSSNYYDTPVQSATTTPTIFQIWPVVDKLLKTQYWFYLRGASTIYQANINTPATQLFFTIYRNLVGTFLVITTWQKSDQRTQINTFVRIGNGFEANSGANYDPVDIKPMIITLALGPNEYKVDVSADGTINVVGGTSSDSSASAQDSTFDINRDMRQKCLLVDGYNRIKQWNYLVKAELVHENHIPTNTQYYCLFLYVNHVGTFLSLSSYNLADKTSSINTFVRLGDGVAEGANYGPVEIRPSMLELTNFQ